MPWEDYLGTQLPAGSRLPPNFKTFDFYDSSTGTAISAKTLDTTTAAKLANSSQVYSSLKGNIDAVARFETYSLGSVPLDSSMIAARELRVAVPSGTTIRTMGSNKSCSRVRSISRRESDHKRGEINE